MKVKGLRKKLLDYNSKETPEETMDNAYQIIGNLLRKNFFQMYLNFTHHLLSGGC